jgi:hypothetical protein
MMEAPNPRLAIAMGKRTRRLYRVPAIAFLLVTAAILVSCGSANHDSNAWQGPVSLSGISVEPWSYPRIGVGHLIRTSHYQIYTTVDDADFYSGAAQIMEGALTQYQALAPTVHLSPTPMDCYIFANRSQWSHWTEHLAGINAHVYLLINRGGYTIGDTYVAYLVGESATWSVASHEGWHQFLAHNMVGRLPPFLEEGLATMFETIQWEGSLPRWNLLFNTRRASALHNAIENQQLWPLEGLVTMHAGNIVGQRGGRIEAFYAQDWAFARYLFNGNGGRFRPALNQILSDAAIGALHDPTDTLNHREHGWNPAGVKPLLEYYLKMPLQQFDVGFENYCRAVALNESN